MMSMMLVTGFLCSTFAQADQVMWSSGTAHTLPKERKEVGVFGPLRIGTKNGLEYQVHPGWFFVSPHLALKKDVIEVNSWNLALRQSVSYPTFLLSGLARAGIGGLLPADAVIPHILSTDTTILITKSVGDEYDLTFWGGLSLAVELGESNWPTIDAPLGYYQTAVYQNIFGLNGGMRITGQAIGKLHYKTEISAAIVPLVDTVLSDNDSLSAALPESSGRWLLTDKSSLIYRFNDGFQAQAGFIFRYGAYPYGRNWHLLPTADLVFGW